MNCLGLRREQDLVILCAAETTNGLALCELCQRKAKTDLEYLPIYFRNLARWSPGGAGRSVPGSREPRTIGTGSDRVSDAMDEAGNALSTWARVLADDRPQLARLLARLDSAHLDERQVMAWLCLGFDRYLTSVATLEWCGQFVLDVADHEGRLQALTLDAAPGWYAGSCRRCTHPTYVVPGLSWVTCGGCGVTTYARDHLDTILSEARTWVAPPKAVAGALVAMLDTEMSVERLYARIRKWQSLGWLESSRKLDADGDPVGPRRYVLGDVLDLALGNADAPTRVARTTSA